MAKTDWKSLLANQNKVKVEVKIQIEDFNVKGKKSELKAQLEIK